ncbi:zinc-dependent alcohol dehydrogenase family protein [Planctomicrobium sp. SH661]|uniref:zinc-dependent alcohol dehydrogenase family protein n=1 Tax=Planctomicrobium sp. SH661 TaxID=3448124 RepID=UPI003F5B3E10
MTGNFTETAICTRHGIARDVVEIQQRAIENPRPGFVRVKMHAAPINPSDLLFCKGNYGIGPQPPTPVGLEGVGIVEASGGGAIGWLRKGKRVSVIARSPGTWSGYCITEAETVIPVPDALSDEQAATFFVNPASALLMTRWIFQIPPRGWIIQSAANSAVGRMIIRLGNHFGFRTLNVVRREEQKAELEAVGADAVIVATDSTPQQEFLDAVKTCTQGDLPRFAVDPVGGKLGGLLLESLGQGGRMLAYASLADEPTPVNPRTLMTQDRHLSSFWLSHAMQALPLLKKLKLIRELSQLHVQGLFQVETFESYPLRDVKLALAANDDKAGGKKILLRMKAE